MGAGLHTPPAAKLAHASFAGQSSVCGGPSPLRPLRAFKTPCTGLGSSHPKHSSSGARCQRAPLHSKKKCLPELLFGCDDNPLKRSKTEPWCGCSRHIPEILSHPGFPCGCGSAIFSEFAALRRLCVQSSDSSLAIPVLVDLSENWEKAMRYKSTCKSAECL